MTYLASELKALTANELPEGNSQENPPLRRSTTCEEEFCSATPTDFQQEQRDNAIYPASHYARIVLGRLHNAQLGLGSGAAAGLGADSRCLGHVNMPLDAGGSGQQSQTALTALDVSGTPK